MKKILSLFLCIPMLFISLFMAHAEEKHDYELYVQDDSGSTKEISTLSYDASQEELYRKTIGVILNESEQMGEIYAGYSIYEELDQNTEYTFVMKNLPDDEQMMLFHILDVDQMMTEEILYEKTEEGIQFKAKPNSLFFFVHMDEVVSYDEEIMLLSDNGTANQVSKDFYYTGNVQEFTAPCSTSYKLEVWGASGGKDKQHEAAGGRIMDGGRGGYSSGEVTLEKGQKLYIVVGGEGESYAFNNSGGGYNGGGDAGGDLSSGGGGGATHIATINLGELSRYSNNRDAVLIVAGGGGGGGYFSTGGHGGGLTANADSSGRSKGGAAGFGSGQSRKSTDDGAGAGGGWTGGKVYVDANDYGAGGGTGYLGNIQNGYSEIGSNSGNGRARLTWTNEVSLDIEYLDKDTEQSLFETHHESLLPESSYSVESPVLEHYLLEDEAQKVIEGTLSSDTTIKVYYKKIPDLKKTVQSNDEDVNEKYIQNGQELTYSLEVENPFNREMNYVVEDTVHSGLDIITINQNGEKKDNTITWNLTLPANSKKIVSFAAKTNGDGLSIANTAKAKISGQEVPSNTVNVYTPTLPIKTVKNIQDEDIDEELVKNDDTFIYQIKIKNQSSSVKEFKITDALLNELEYFDISDYGVIQDDELVWVVQLQANEEKVLSFKANIKKDITEITNQVKQSVDQTNVESNTVKNYVAKEPVKKVLNKNNESIDQEIVKKNEEVQYVISLENTANIAKTFTVEDEMPLDFEIISVNTDASIQDRLITLTKELPANSTFDVVIKGKPLKDSTGFENTANVKVDHLNFDTNSVLFYTSTPPTKNVLDEQNNNIMNALIYAGENRKLTYTITIHNPCSFEKEFEVKDALNKALVFVSASDEGKYSEGRVIWNLKLAANEKKVLTLVVKPNDEYVGEKLTNVATLSSTRYSENTNTVVNYFDDKPEKIQIKGTVAWDDGDNKDKLRPGAVTIRLYANGTEIRNQKVITNSDMTFLFDQVQKYQKGKEIEYTISEDDISGYSITINPVKDQEHEFEVINKHVVGVKVTPVTPTTKPTVLSSNTTKVAPNTGDDYSIVLPASAAVFALMLGVMVILSLRKWK